MLNKYRFIYVENDNLYSQDDKFILTKKILFFGFLGGKNFM